MNAVSCLCCRDDSALQFFSPRGGTITIAELFCQEDQQTLKRFACNQINSVSKTSPGKRFHVESFGGLVYNSFVADRKLFRDTIIFMST